MSQCHLGPRCTRGHQFARTGLIVGLLQAAACAVYDGTPHDVLRPVPTRPQAPDTPEKAQTETASGPDDTPPSAAIGSAGSRAPECNRSSADDPCAQLPQLIVEPAVDGVLECGLRLHQLPLTAATAALENPSGVPDASGASVAYAAAWSQSAFYVYVEVHSALSAAPGPNEPLYCGDSVEFFVDSDGVAGANGAYNAPGTMQFIVAAPRGDANPRAGRFAMGAAQGNWISDSVRAVSREDGYAVEALIRPQDLGLWTWRPTALLGFDLAVNLSGAGTKRGAPCTTAVGQSVLRAAAASPGCDGLPWCDTRSFCTPLLAP